MEVELTGGSDSPPPQLLPKAITSVGLVDGPTLTVLHKECPPGSHQGFSLDKNPSPSWG